MIREGKMRNHGLTRSVALIALIAASGAAGSASAADVTFERLLNADKEPQNWLTNHQDYDSHRHSALDQINRDTVGGLKLAYALALGGFDPGGSYPYGSLQATPLVDDGSMFVTDGWGSVYRIDVSSGERALIQWKMDPGADRSLPAGIPTNRGVALLGSSVYSVSVDGRLIKSNAVTGEIVWDKQATDQDAAYLTVAPLAVQDKIIIGVSGADSGIRGWIDAYNAETGDQVWRRWLIPAPGEPGSETWKDDHNAWETGGGSAWVTGSYDAQQDLLVWGVGNPAPDFDAAYRPGDNLYTNSVLALRSGTGEIAWYFQYTPNDSWDFDEEGVHILVDAEVDGASRKLVLHSARNGFYYALDRTSGAYVNGAQYSINVNWTAGIDPKTGKPVEYVPNADFQAYAGVAPTHDRPVVDACPTIGGGNNYFPSAYSPVTKMFYVVGTEGCSHIEQIPFEPGEWKQGDDPGFGKITNAKVVGASLSAINVATGAIAKRIETTYANDSGILSTAGGLIFTGFLDGSLKAYNNETLEEMWSVNVGTPFNAPPMSFAVNGKQYIAILAGVGVIAKGNLFGHPELDNINSTSMMFVFSL